MTSTSTGTRAAAMLFLANALWSLPVGAQDAAQPFDHSGLARQTLEQHIVPGYSRLAEAAKQLSRTLDQTCAKPFTSRPKAVDAAFDNMVTAWGRIEHINFGPITSENRLERILFFPDRRGLSGRACVGNARSSRHGRAYAAGEKRRPARVGCARHRALRSRPIGLRVGRTPRASL
jgi:hypothetical protein